MESLHQAASNARELGLVGTPTCQLLDQAMEIATAVQRSVYDSLYVALAMRLNTDLITADERLFNALGAHFPIRWLGRYDLSGRRL